MPGVRPNMRSDGTPVRGHSRAQDARREMTIFAGFALAVVALGNGNASAGSGGAAPRPQSTVQYPIRFEDKQGNR